jgi:DNA mismatch repair protein MutL
MSRRIHILPDALADQIAAGEVVERPASVVKELAENSLDAGARHVRVELEQGGKTFVQVSDDGHGMGREDAVLALDRHATSKIKSAGDLVGIGTFGFRGEALPAIASISRFTLATAEADGEGTEVQVAGGRVDRVAAVARQRGTTIAVRALFFNTPARRKFLRSVASETRAAHDALATLALAHPSVGFELVIDGQTRLAVPAGQTLEERLASVWGRDLAGTLLAVEYAHGGFRVDGFVQRPGDAKPTGRRTQLFINGRPFKDNFLVRAAEAGYRAAIHPGDRPSLFLRLRTDPAEVDVNVHPAKLEVRFRNRIEAERVVEEAVRDVLGRMEAAASVGEGRAMPTAGGREAGRPGGQWVAVAAAAAPVLDFFAPSDAPGEPVPQGEASGEATPPPSRPPALPPLFQLFDTYIVYETADGAVFVDQHSAHERVLYEAVLAQLTNGGAASQRLLLAETVELTDEELDAVEAHGDELRRVGFEVEPFGGRTVVVQAVPNPHPRFDALGCLREMVADLARGRFGGWHNRLERFAATYACRAAVKAGQRLETHEMRELLTRLFATELPPHDVHGRSTIVQLPRDELERRFGRR